MTSSPVVLFSQTVSEIEGPSLKIRVKTIIRQIIFDNSCSGGYLLQILDVIESYIEETNFEYSS